MSFLPTLAVTDGDLEQYPLDEDVRLDSHGFISLQHKRWLNSELHLRGTMAVQGAAFNLICIAHDQTPVGTLPVDEDLIARLLRITLEEWRAMMAQPVTPLHKWRRCLCGVEVRLMHDVVLATVQDALHRREVNQRSNADKAVYARRNRLRQAWRDLGVREAILNDDVLIERVDDWLAETCRGQRRVVVYERALRHAIAEKWLSHGI